MVQPIEFSVFGITIFRQRTDEYLGLIRVRGQLRHYGPGRSCVAWRSLTHLRAVRRLYKR